MTGDMWFRRASGLFCLALSACYGTPRTSSGDAGGGADGAMSIAITSPASPTYTNKAIEIDVSVASGGAAAAVQLLDNGALLTTLTAPTYKFTWDTTKVAEGNHQLVAQEAVGGQIVASAPVTIIVDRTSPTIVSKSPGTGADNVSLTDPIQVVFSEALAPASITAGSVSLSLGSAAVGGTATLGTDGKTIGVAIANRSSLALPGTMTEMVGTGITDLAGNAFAGASWSFTVPLWVDLGSVAGNARAIALDPSGAPVVLTDMSNTMQIARYLGGTSWDTSIPSPQAAGSMAYGSIAVGASNDIFLAWYETTSQPVYVARWTGSAWDRSYGTLLTLSTASVGGPTIALTSAGQPVVRWVEPVNMGRGPGYVSRWNGSSWTAYAGAPGDYSGPVVVDHSDLPITLAGNQMSRWTGSAWTAPQGTGVYGLAVNSTDVAVGLQITSDGFQPLALSKTGVLTNYVPALTGESPSDGYGVAIDKNDEPIVTWFSYVGGTASSFAQVHAARWTGSAWDKGYGILPNASGRAVLALAAASIPIVAWTDFNGTPTHISKSNH